METPNDIEKDKSTSDHKALENIQINVQVPIITDSCMKRKLTKEEEKLNIENDYDVSKNGDKIDNVGPPNNVVEKGHFIDNFASQSNEKLTNVIENLGEDELFEDPDFPAVPNSLFYRYLSNAIF